MLTRKKPSSKVTSSGYCMQAEGGSDQQERSENIVKSISKVR